MPDKIMGQLSENPAGPGQGEKRDSGGGYSKKKAAAGCRLFRFWLFGFRSPSCLIPDPVAVSDENCTRGVVDDRQVADEAQKADGVVGLACAMAAARGPTGSVPVTITETTAGAGESAWASKASSRVGNAGRWV